MNVQVVKWRRGASGVGNRRPPLPPRHLVLCSLSPQASTCSQSGYSAMQGSLKLVRSDQHTKTITVCRLRLLSIFPRSPPVPWDFLSYCCGKPENYLKMNYCFFLDKGSQNSTFSHLVELGCPSYS